MQISFRNLAGWLLYVLEVEGTISLEEFLEKLRAHGVIPASAILRVAKGDDIIAGTSSSWSLESLGVEDGSIFTLVTEHICACLVVSEGKATIVSCASGDCMRTLEHDGINHAEFSPDGSFVVTLSHRGGRTAKIWNVASGDCMHTLEHDGMGHAEFSPDGSFIGFTRNLLSMQIQITCVLERSVVSNDNGNAIDLDMLETCLKDTGGDVCLEHQAQLQMVILESRLSEELGSLSNANELECIRAFQDASSSGDTLSGLTSAPSSSLSGIQIHPQHAILSKACLPLESLGTVDHHTGRCLTCMPHLRSEIGTSPEAKEKVCPRGYRCHRCHDPSHQEDDRSRSSGRARYRAAKQKATIRKFRTPSPDERR